MCLWVLPLTSAALPGAHLLRAQVGSVVVRFMEVILLLFPLLVEILKAVQHRVCLFLVIVTCRRKKNCLKSQKRDTRPPVGVLIITSTVIYKELRVIKFCTNRNIFLFFLTGRLLGF